MPIKLTSLTHTYNPEATGLIEKWNDLLKIQSWCQVVLLYPSRVGFYFT